MTTWMWILILIAALVIVGLIAVAGKKRRTAALRQRFGDEYERTVQARDDRRAAEAELLGRQKKRAQLDIRPLSEQERGRFAEDWHAGQERFVDEPANAVETADSLVGQVMRARGYPMDDFESQSDLLSVDHPTVVENYRFAHAIYVRSQTQQASTEDLREAMLRYRSLFDELLGTASAETTRASADTTGTPADTAATPAGATGAPAERADTPAGLADTAAATPADTAGAPADASATTARDDTRRVPADATGAPPESDGRDTAGEHYDTMRRGTR
jgi:hypothetical protein